MSNLTWDNLYTDYANEYEMLVSHEDYQNNLLAAIEQIEPLAGMRTAEFGCGTGRVSALLARQVRWLYAFDFTRSMLRLTQAKQENNGWKTVSLAQADSRQMPVRSSWADFAIEGWAFLQIAVWHPHDWQNQLGRALDEMQRVVRPGGKMILIETLGTGESTPKPAPFHRIVYDYLEDQHGFTPLNLRTDYCFETLEQIQQVVVPLFGPEMLGRLVDAGQGWILPECTGLWWRGVPE
jgi:ubiquinone/menaquinone biosynthesis C-methylase UbiE